MAYVSQENKKEKAGKLKPILKKYGVKATLSVYHHSTLCLNISSSPIDFIGNHEKTMLGLNNPGYVYSREYIQVNTYWYKENFTGTALSFLTEAMDILNGGNFDKSDYQTDYFHVGWYVNINIGKYHTPYNFLTGG